MYGLSSALSSYEPNRVDKNFTGRTVQMRSFAQAVSNFAKADVFMSWFHYSGQKSHEKDNGKYLSLSLKCHAKSMQWCEEAKAGKR